MKNYLLQDCLWFSTSSGCNGLI